MRTLWKLLFFLISGCSFLSAQNLSDFQLRMQNSFLKLYENPAVAIRSAKEIRTEETETPVQNILSKAYLLQGNYLESVQVALEKSTSTVGDEELRKILILS